MDKKKNSVGRKSKRAPDTRNNQVKVRAPEREEIYVAGWLTNSEYDWFAAQAAKVGATIQGFVAAQLKEIYQRANPNDGR